VEEFGGVDKVIELLNKVALEHTGFELSWTVKPIEEYHPIDFNYQIEEVKRKDEYEGVWNDVEAAERVVELYPHWKFCNGKLYVFDDETGLWDFDRSLHFKIFKKLSDKLCTLPLDKGDDKKTPKSYGNTLNLIQKLPPLIESECVDNEWIKQNQFTGLHKILFRNGYYDFNQQKFYSKEEYGFNPDILFFDRINHDFDDFDMDYVKDIRQRLFYNSLGETLGNYMILNIARGLAGERMK
jgi:hypothetical protein